MVSNSLFRPLHGPGCQVACSACNLREICLPLGLSKSDLERIDGRLVTARRKLARGQPLYHAGDPFESIYAVWTGFFKTCVSSKEGREQVIGFQMGGELLGLDGIGNRTHELDAVALEDSQVCVIPFHDLERLALEVPSLQAQLHRILSRELVRTHGVMLLLGSMHAEERLAAFLLNLSYRLSARGFSDSDVVLRMSRVEIGSYLGLTLETVSRMFSRFQAQGLLSVRHKQIHITDAPGLQRLLEGEPA